MLDLEVILVRHMTDRSDTENQAHYHLVFGFDLWFAQERAYVDRRVYDVIQYADRRTYSGIYVEAQEQLKSLWRERC